jgi:hypothetical protein
MRVYKFLDGRSGLKSLRGKRLRVSRINELNDPFELTPYALTDPSLRRALKKTRDRLAARRGVLCFSACCHDPVIWAHYCDKHKGLCLGFEIPMDKDDDKSLGKRVRYVPKRLPFPADFLHRCDAEKAALVQGMLFTKYKNWEYEQEVRIWAQLNDADEGNYFADFDENLVLREVIAGARCPLSRTAIVDALGAAAKNVKLVKARAGFRGFEIVPDKRGLR